MSTRIARISLMMLTTLLLAIWLPMLHTMLFEERFGKTHLFYSPTIKEFVYKELVGEGHQLAYRDAKGNDYSRKEFEFLNPFIYYKNMEMWGHLPLVIDGNTYDKQAIRSERMVVEIKPRDLAGNSPRVQLFPLLESNPGRVRLSFPTNVFRPSDQLEFVDSDLNAFDPALTDQFTQALAGAGFEFPVSQVFGRVSILKAYDSGFLLQDSNGALFKLKKRDGEAVINRIELPSGLEVRHVAITESKQREILGIVIGTEDEVYLLTEGNFDLIPLQLPDFDADSMELKVIFDPLYRTAIYSDNERIYSVAMDRDFTSIATYQRTMAIAEPRLVDEVWHFLVPFELQMSADNTRYIQLNPVINMQAFLVGNLLVLGFVLAMKKWRVRDFAPSYGELLFIALGGVYGLVACWLWPSLNREQKVL
ncbi:DUF4857 domain-containing protein [Rhodobacteraceae bacterium RKSG542]|uniref:DUF4857 domain-containing protein n=1 Tax=Pseudovibrio flavus TaxID=2529854 RepID=UPI0012BB9393|nr:DUF4857 domain-containing protein [Pseudovibrio flavus]MTI17470.1 DUF4857 domain-containing protein [Pseudovibrio flavus]